MEGKSKIENVLLLETFLPISVKKKMLFLVTWVSNIKKLKKCLDQKWTINIVAYWVINEWIMQL